MLSLPSRMATEVYFYLPDTWRVVATAIRLHYSVKYAQAICCLGHASCTFRHLYVYVSVDVLDSRSVGLWFLVLYTFFKHNLAPKVFLNYFSIRIKEYIALMLP